VAGLDQLALRLAVFDFGLIPVPELEPGEKLRLLVGELAVRRVGRPLPLLRPLARILHRKRGGDHQHLAQAAFVAGGDDHPPERGSSGIFASSWPVGVSACSAVTAPSSSSNW
jgi:hypothetical protein